MLKSLNSWAHKVKQIASTKKLKNKVTSSKIDRLANYIENGKRPDVQKVVTVRSAKDVDKIDQVIASVPKDRKGFAKAIKKVSRVQLAEDERLFMVDSGSFEHAIDAESELPDHPISIPSNLDKERSGETACGRILKVLGKVTVNGLVGNTKVTIPFKHMKVKCPILSVRKLVRDGNDVHFSQHGGWIENATTGQRIELFAFQGVYFLKVKILPPVPSAESTDPPVESANSEGFARQGA